MNTQNVHNMKKASMGVRQISPKTFAAFTLAGLMVLLWGRVLLKGKDGPQAAHAETAQALPQDPPPRTPAVELTPVALPVLAGRHDRLTNNLFSDAHWTAFPLREKEETAVAQVVPSAPAEDPQEVLRRRHRHNLDAIAARLKLEAVIGGANGKPQQVFINEKILTVGSVLTVQEGPDSYDLTLTELWEKEALFSWNEDSLTLKMADPGHP